MIQQRKSLKQIIDAASPRVNKVVVEILEIEREFQSYKDLGSTGTGQEKEIAHRIKKLIKAELKESR
ncbi:MAG: hypothetical protein OXC63_11670 [Aestuariivita sp.]|nr:hypothetical protein [Aestuariivita sp.]MCY4346905.1 hypothetical protein [Aestuariivita sp.]